MKAPCDARKVPRGHGFFLPDHVALNMFNTSASGVELAMRHACADVAGRDAHPPRTERVENDGFERGDANDADASCMLCGALHRANSEEGNGLASAHGCTCACGMQHAWSKCMVCGTGKRRGLLGESGEVAKAAQETLKDVVDVHTSDSLMHFECLGPYWELTEV